jgi:hypothetical protein
MPSCSDSPGEQVGNCLRDKSLRFGIGNSVFLFDDLATDLFAPLKQILKADAFLFKRFFNFIEGLGNDHLGRLDYDWKNGRMEEWKSGRLGRLKVWAV